MFARTIACHIKPLTNNPDWVVQIDIRKDDRLSCCKLLPNPPLSKGRELLQRRRSRFLYYLLASLLYKTASTSANTIAWQVLCAKPRPLNPLRWGTLRGF
jgi:hypothetical protein